MDQNELKRVDKLITILLLCLPTFATFNSSKKSGDKLVSELHNIMNLNFVFNYCFKVFIRRPNLFNYELTFIINAITELRFAVHDHKFRYIILADSFPHFDNENKQELDMNYENLIKAFYLQQKQFTVLSKCSEKLLELIMNELRRLLIYCGISFTIFSLLMVKRQTNCCLLKNFHSNNVHCVPFYFID